MSDQYDSSGEEVEEEVSGSEEEVEAPKRSRKTKKWKVRSIILVLSGWAGCCCCGRCLTICPIFRMLLGPQQTKEGHECLLPLLTVHARHCEGGKSRS